MTKRLEDVRSIQASLTEQAAGFNYEEYELQDLRVIARLTVEFFYYLENLERQWDDRYVADSVFSGVDYFRSALQSYQCRSGAIPGTIQWDGTVEVNIRRDFLSKYREFQTETNFEKRCRLLLDMFKLQIVFAGLAYD